MKRNTKNTGDFSEAMLLAAFVRKGTPVLTPFGDNQRYDLVIETSAGFKRIQCKTGRLKNGVIQFAAASSAYHRGGKRQCYTGQIDFFGVYCPENQKCYLIPIKEAPARNVCTLRVSPTGNNQTNRVRWAADFEIM